MGIDNGVRDSLPPSVTAEFHKPTLRDKIQNIFNKKQSPSETFQDLAKLEPESVSKPIESTSETLNTPIQTEDTQQETDKKIVQIREQLGLLETKIKPDSELIKFKEALGLDQVQIDKRKANQSERLESSIKYELNFKDNYHWSEDYISENNLKKLQERQELMKTLIDKMSPIEKLSKNIERIRVIKKLEKSGVPNAKNIIKSLEEIASPLIFNPRYDFRDNIYGSISYNLSDENSIEIFKKINDFNQGEPINPDFFKRIVILDGYKKTYPLEISKYLKFNKLNKNQFDQFISLRSDYFMIIYQAPGLIDNLIEKITSGNFSDEDLRSQLSDKVRLDALGNFLVEKGFSFNYSGDLEISSQTIESFFINSPNLYQGKNVLKYLASVDFKNLNLEEKKIIWETLSLGIGIDKYCIEKVDKHGYMEPYEWLSSDLLNDSKFLINNLHSQNKDYFHSIIDYLNTPDVKIISILSQFSDILKTEDGINLIKSFKEDKNPYKLFKSIAEIIIINNNQKPNNGFLQALFLYQVDEDLSEKLLKPENFINFSTEDQKFWNCLININGDDKVFIQGLIIKNRNRFSEFFDENGQPTSVLFEAHIISDYFNEAFMGKDDFLPTTLTSELLKTFSEKDQKMWNYLLKINSSDKIINKFIIENKNEISEFFDANNQPTSVFFEQFIKNNLSFREDNPLRKLLTPEVLQSFSPEDQKMWNILISLNSNNNQINQFIIDNKEKILQKIKSPEQLDQYIAIINQINSSPSKEILKIKDQLLTEILNNDNPFEAYQKISDIFIKNNLPMIGKIYRVFDTLYPPQKVKQMLENNSDLSRVLVNNSSLHLRQSIIFNDLLQINLGSGELSLVNYLNLFQTSSPLLEKARSSENLNQTESSQLSAFFKKLDTLYDSSLLSRIQSTKTLDTSTLQSKISELYLKYRVKKGQSISDRVSEMYLSRLGINSITEAINYSNQVRESAHQRNLTRTNFSLAPGDLVKGISSDNIDKILNFGCVSREYLGVDSGSDSTPFDTDTIRSDSIHTAQKISSVGANGYGDLFIIIKDRGQFQNTTKVANPKYDPTKLEVFYSGFGGQNHYGVRTGFSSSEIDFLVSTDTNPQKLENIYYQIAKHGVYIPVLNNQGNQIFTPQDYQRYRHSFDGVKQFGGDPIQIETSQLGDPFRQEIDTFKKTIENESSDEVIIADTKIKEKVKSILDSLGIDLKDQFDTSILGSRLYNIGSSGRHTNLPGDFDFDYNLVLDAPSYSKSQQLITEINRQFAHQSEINSVTSQIRFIGVTGATPEPIDLDIGINTTASTLIFASHEAIEQKLESIKQTYGEDTYNEVIANILLAKKILKENHAYKKSDIQDGGFGGIGTENWILANNGSIKKAFETFWQAAHNNDKELSLDEFRKQYFILDPGENLRDTGRNHDNFIFALTEKGYKSMLTTIKKYLSH